MEGHDRSSEWKGEESERAAIKPLAKAEIREAIWD
jgi:hypothetical protein